MIKKRYSLIDEIRGLAVVLMIIFHGAYDLNFFGFVSIDFHRDLFWWFLPRLIVFLFLFTMGMSLGLVHKKSIQWQPFAKRFLKISFFALIISVATYFTFPTRWIYFGTLHCIATCSLLALPFVKREKLAGVLALILIIPLAFKYQYPWVKLPHQSMDYIPAIPWLAATLLGIYAYHLKLHTKELSPNKFTKLLAALGKKSLLIYLLHQPLLFGVVFLLSKFVK